VNSIEHVHQLAREKGLDPDKVKQDLIDAAIATNSSAEEIARAFLIAIDWQGPILPAWLPPEIEGKR